MAEDPNVHPHWAAETKQIAKGIDFLDYFQVLGTSTDAPLQEIKTRYHALQRNYHPDTFYGSPDEELRAAVFKISKRVAEAWVVIRDPEKREKYTRDIAGPDRVKKLRFTEISESEVRREKEEEFGKTPQGRQLAQKAIASLKAGDASAAVRDFKMALLFEKDNEALKRYLAEAEAELKTKGPAGKAAPPKAKTP